LILIRIQKATHKQLNQWDKYIDSSINGTLFHKFSFLAYHGDKFREKEHYLVVLKGDHPIGHMPLLVDKIEDKRIAKSPYGGSYGGIAFQEYPTYSIGQKIVQELVNYLNKEKIFKFTLTPPIGSCSEKYLDTFYFNLIEAGFTISNRDISSIIKFDPENTISKCITSKARGHANRAIKKGLVIVEKAPVEDFWHVLSATFVKHGVAPTHTQEELYTLSELCKNDIHFDVGYLKGIPVAGICRFRINSRVIMAFYLAQDPVFQSIQALSCLVKNSLEKSEKEKFLYYDFGTSTIDMQARSTIFKFKERFSCTGIFRETYCWYAS